MRRLKNSPSMLHFRVHSKRWKTWPQNAQWRRPFQKVNGSWQKVQSGVASMGERKIQGFSIQPPETSLFGIFFEYKSTFSTFTAKIKMALASFAAT